MGSEFQIIFRTLAILALVANILFLIISVPWIIENYDTQNTNPRIRLELYVSIHLLLSGFFISYIFYEGFKNRQIIYFSTTFSIIGITFVLFGSLINVPYSSVSEVRTEFSRDWTGRIYNVVNDNERAVYKNGSLRAISISPNSSETYVWDYYGEVNTSIFQIDIGVTGIVFFIIAELEQERDLYTGERDVKRIFINWTIYGDGPTLDWYTRFWTIPYRFGGGSDKAFVFENPNDYEIAVSIKVTEFYLKATKEVEEIYYDNLFLDQSYAYGGLLLLGVSVVLTTLFPMKSKSNLDPKNP